MSPKFRARSSVAAVADTPERLYEDLPREPGAPDALWAHQADVLRAYHSSHLTTRDVALELPTGAGKTLPGLLIAEWRRRSLRHRVLYACPTQQLARQTIAAARKIGIDAVILIGSHHGWTTVDKLRYEAARSMAVTTYSTVFNVRPALEPAQTLLFDDAHAAEQFVAGAWSIEVIRFDQPELYQQLLEVFRPALDGVTFQLLSNDDDPTRRTVQMIGVAQMRRATPRLLDTFSQLSRSDDLYWRVEAVRDRLDRCQTYITWDAILTRPFIPPTASHRHFIAPEQRVYLSATLGEGGELERAFGRSPITRLPIPAGWDSRGAGRRFFIFPDLQTGIPARELTASAIAEAGKALVLAPSTKRADAARDLAPDGAVVLGPQGSVDNLLDNFRSAPCALLTLAGRYDGLDLPNAQCRVTVLDGMPSGAHLQERFLSETLLAGRVLRERLRTRVVQGAGRCTRGLSDHSVVVVLGDEVTRFINLPDVHDALRPELQAEIDFGLDNSAASLDELVEFIRSFLDQDRDWREQAEPALLKARKAAHRVRPPENVELATAARHEVKAVTCLWSGDWAGASKAALNTAGVIQSPQLTGYRALWTYLAAAWLAEEAEERRDEALKHSALDLLRKAHAVGRSTSWLRQVQPLPEGERALDELDHAAVRRATEHGPSRLNSVKWATRHTELLEGLNQPEARRYERALVELGTLLGCESYKPEGDGRADTAWVWPYLWLAIEAKTEERGDVPVSQATVRQANDQLKTLAYDRNETVPDGSAVLIVGPRQLVDPTAAVVAEPFVHIAFPEAMVDLAKDAVRAWKVIRAQGSGMSDEQLTGLIGRELSEHRVLPSDVRARLLQDPVQG